MDRADPLHHIARRVLDEAPLVVVVLEGDGSIHYVNPCFERITGCTVDEVRGRDWVETFVPEDERGPARERLAAPLDRTRGAIDRVAVRAGGAVVVEWVDASPWDQPEAAPGVFLLGRVRPQGTETFDVERLARLGTWTRDVHTGETVWSDVGQEILGYRPELGPPSLPLFMGLVHPEDRGRMAAHARENLTRGEPGEIEYRVVHPDGALRHVLSRSERVLDGSGGVLGLRGILLDITSRKQAEDDLRVSEQRYALVEGAVSDGIWDWNIATDDAYLSPRWKALLGYEDHELPNMAATFFDLLHPDDGAAVIAAHTAHLEGGERHDLELRLRHKDGGYRWFRARGEAMRDDTGRPVRMLGSITDTTEERRAAERLRASEASLRQAQRIARLGSWELDLQTARLTWSDEIFRIFELDPERFSASYDAFLAAIHPDDRAPVDAAYRASVRDRTEYQFDHRLVMTDGRIKWVQERGRTEYADDGRPVRSLGTVQDITEQRHAEDALRASEERYRRLFEEATEGICEVARGGRLVRVNPALAAMLGYDEPAELVGTNIRDYYWETRPASALDRLEREDVVTGLLRTWRHRSGERIETEAFGQTIRDEDGTIIGYHCILRDVTAQRQSDAALRLLSTGLARVTGDAFFREIAAQLAVISGAESAFVAALDPTRPGRIRTLARIVDGVAQPRLELDVAGTPCEAVVAGQVLIICDGVEHRFARTSPLMEPGAAGYAAAPLVDAGGTVIGLIGLVSRKPIAYPERIEPLVTLFALRAAAELERQRADARFGGVFEFAPDALLIVDAGGRVVQANQMAVELFGYSRDELHQMSVDDLVPEPVRAQHAVLRRGYLAQPKTRRMGSTRSRLWALRKDGVRLPVETSISPLRLDHQRLVVAAVRDVSARVLADAERSRLEDQLRQAQKMESLGTLAGGIAHDFNNILTAIFAHVELARVDLADDDPLARSLDAIGNASTRAARLVEQILTFSRRQPARRTVTALAGVVEEVATLLCATLPAGIRVETRIADDAPQVLADPTQIHQVLMNLGTNAWHAIERPTGTIILALDRLAAPPPVLDLPPGRYARLQVIDDGAGMDAATAERIFEPFFTTKGVGKGTGLGLAVVHGIITDHGGRVTVESQVGSGTTFSVYLRETSSGPVRRAVASTAPRKGAARVLLIDDEPELVVAAQAMLERIGYRVTGFVQPAEAVAAVRADPGRFDVVITDLNMPELGGLDVARAVKGLRADLPVVVVSGIRAPPEARLREAGVDQTLAKPYRTASLGDAVERALRRT